MPPVLVGGLESDLVEEVLLARDEGANQAWAVERRVPTPQGGSLDRSRTAPTPRPAPAATGGTAAYRLMSDVPDHWFPLLPLEPRPGAYVFRLGHLDGPDGEPLRPPGPGRGPVGPALRPDGGMTGRP